MSAESGRPADNQPAAGNSEGSAVEICPQCGDPLPRQTVGGSCPKCLMSFALTETLPETEQVGRSQLAGGLPDRFGRYTIVRRLGQGAMGIVYLAKDSQLDRLVAIKVPLFGTSSEEAVVDRFQREVRAAAALRHPNICPIHDVGQIEGTLYMTMAYIEGRSLAELMAAEIPLWQSIQMVRKLAAALAEAHRQGVIHRDLKPANIMIDQRNEPLIMDFGLARRRHEDLKVTRSGTLVGTPAYMPPEQVRGEPTSPASDIYSLGVILYELLTRRLPFKGELFDVLNQIVQRRVPPPSSFNPKLASQLDDICLRSLAKQPKARFASMDEFARALTEYLQLAEPQQTTVLTPPRWGSGIRRVPRNVWYGLSCAAFGLLLVTAVSRRYSSPAPPADLAPARQRDKLAKQPSLGPEKKRGDAETVIETPPPAAQTAAADNSLNNLVMGRYLCFVDGNWVQGLPLLARSTDESLRTLASRELAVAGRSGQATIAEQVAVADAWREFAEQETNPAIVTVIRSHAAQGYRQALGALQGGDAERVREWLAAHDAAQTPAREPAVIDSPTSVDEPPTEEAPLVAKPATQEHTGEHQVAADRQVQGSGRTEGESLVALALQELARIEAERRALAEQTRENIARRDIDIPQAIVKASGEVARLARLEEELAAEVREIDFTARDLQKQRLNEENRFNILAIDRKLQLLGQRRVRTVQRGHGYATERRGQSAEIKRLEAELVRLRRAIEQSATRARQLLGEAFWAAEPTGSFAAEDYLRIAEDFSKWLVVGQRSDLFALRSIALINGGQHDAATEHAKQAVHLKPKSSLALAAQGYVKANSGNSAEAIRELTRSLRLAPQFSAAFLFRGLVYRRTAKHESARRDLSRAVQLAPSNPWVHCHLAWQFAASPEPAHRDAARAVEHAEFACSATGRNSWICLAALAAALAESGRFAEAVRTQKAALELAPAERESELTNQLHHYESGRPFRWE